MLQMRMIRFLFFFILVFSTGCAASSSSSTYKAIYLVKKEEGGQLSQADLEKYPEVFVAHTFQEVKDHAGSKVAIWIDSDAIDLLGEDYISKGYNGWIYQPPQGHYPYVLVGVGNYLPPLIFEGGPPSALGTPPEQSTPGFTVWKITKKENGRTDAWSKGYEQHPTVAGILEVTNALLDEQTPPTSLPTPVSTAVPIDNPLTSLWTEPTPKIVPVEKNSVYFPLTLSINETTEPVTLGCPSCMEVSLTPDGRFVGFNTFARYTSEETHNLSNIYVYDRQTGSFELVSVSSYGEHGNGSSYTPKFSADGRYVAFQSDASDFTWGDTNKSNDVFVHDRQSGQTERVSVSSNGGQANSWSGSPSISADGRFVAFESNASNLVDGDTNERWDIFVHDRLTGSTERVSVSFAGEQGNGNSTWATISADGRFVSFHTDSSNLVNGDTNGISDIFVRDRQQGITERVSLSSTGDQGNGGSSFSSISADGRFVVFGSGASNLVPGDTNGTADIFVHDRQNGITERVSVSLSGHQANATSFGNIISADGRIVVYRSAASNLVPGDTNGLLDIFVYDRQTRMTERISVSTYGEQENAANGEFGFAISADGRFVAFVSNGSNFVSGDPKDTSDIFIRDRCPDGSCVSR